jgi:DMSO/TMAO reductase YedYZ heme-binding membrane subunit
MNDIEIMDRIADYVNVYIWLGTPEVLKGIIITLVFVILFRKKLKERPTVFYVYPVLYFLLGIFCGVGNLLPGNRPDESWVVNIEDFLLFLDDLGLGTTFGIGFIVIVMFIGVLPKNTFVKALFTIRTEMSIIGATLLMGHGFLKLDYVKGWIKPREYEPDFLIIFFWIFGILGPILLMLLVLPWITSFQTVRKKLSGRTWKKLQTCLGVPLFIAMLVFGLVLNLAWSVAWYPDFVNMPEITVRSGGKPVSLGTGVSFGEELLSAKIYLVMLVSYIILRIKKVRKASRPGVNPPAETEKATA